MTFLTAVFTAKIVKESRYEDGTVQHARLQVGDSLIMLNQANGTYAALQMQMHLYVTSVDSTHAKAISEGATSIMQPMLRPHGDRMAGFRDPMGNVWWIAETAQSVCVWETKWRQFCVYVANGIVISSLDPDMLEQFRDGTMNLDRLTKQYVRDRLDYQYAAEENSAEAFAQKIYAAMGRSLA